MNVLDMRPLDAMAALRGHGLDALAARRVLTASVRDGVTAIARVPGVPASRREGLARAIELPRLEIRERRVDPADGFAKYLLSTHDGLLVEAVRIPLLTRDPGAPRNAASPPLDASGDDPALEKRFTVCLSSEAGCAMGCTFCATARLGLQRRLEAWEIVAQLRAVREEAPGRVTGAVLMGMGEPFDNWERVARALDILEDQGGIALGKRHVTVSTVGMVPGIERFAAEGRRERLAFSLVTAVEEKRRRMVPLARKYDLASVKTALRGVLSGPGKHSRILVAIVMIGGVTTSEEDARAAVEFLKDLPCWIDLIDVNDRQGGLLPPSKEERQRFIHTLREAGQPIQVRYSGGQAIEAGCGMLAATSAGGRAVAPTSGILPHPRNGAGPLPMLTD